MNLRQLEAFRAVMQTGSVTRAAELLRVSQPAISQLLAQFERKCGLELFVRRGNRIAPTHDADALYSEVQLVFSGIGRIGRVATALREQSWGSLAIAAFPALARRILPAIVTSFCADRPDARFGVESMRSRSLIDAVATRHVDLGFSVLPGDRPEVESVHLRRLRGLCIVPAAHKLARRSRIAAADLEGERFISLGPQDHSRFMIDRVFDTLEITRRIQIETGQSETTHSFVAEGAGVAIVDPISVYNSRDPRITARPFDPEVAFDVWLIRPKFAEASGLLMRFQEEAIAGLNATFDQLDQDA